MHVRDVLVTDGSSTDGTAEKAAAAGARVVTDAGKGKGRAIRNAIPHLASEVTVLMDADCSHDPNDIPKLAAPIVEGRADHVSGSRLLGGSSELHGGFDEWTRLAGSSFITACINWRYGIRLSDSQNGFRAIRTDVLKSLKLRSRHTTIEQEMWRLSERATRSPRCPHTSTRARREARISRCGETVRATCCLLHG